jgi:hypothetical protein
MGDYAYLWYEHTRRMRLFVGRGCSMRRYMTISYPPMAKVLGYASGEGSPALNPPQPPGLGYPLCWWLYCAWAVCVMENAG